MPHSDARSVLQACLPAEPESPLDQRRRHEGLALFRLACDNTSLRMIIRRQQDAEKRLDWTIDDLRTRLEAATANIATATKRIAELEAIAKRVDEQEKVIARLRETVESMALSDAEHR